MKQDWRIYAKKADFNAISAKYGIDPVIARILRNRDVVTDKDFEKYLYGTLDSVCDPREMLDMELGTDIIASAIEAGENIRVVGDYDVDGVMSTYILYDGLKNAGANVSYDIPHRIHDGYGINERIIRKAFEEGIDVIITCDNGIAAVNSIAVAAELGMTVVVTDHHEIQDALPEADAIIDPHQEGDGYAYPDICGAVVAYKFIQVLYDSMGIELPGKKYLEMLALATVCDVMPLLDENRIYVREGLRELEKTENTGLQALLKVTEMKGKNLGSYSLGFVIGPCINAAGRLEDAKLALELLLETDEAEAEKKAEYLKKLNDSRKSMTEEGEKKAMQVLAPRMTEIDGEMIPTDSILVLYIEGLHESLAGIVAGRIKERYYRPTIIFTDSDKDGSIIKGSGRSTDAYNMFEGIIRHKDMMVKFGGHPLAAGLTIKRENLDKLRELLNEECGLTERDMIPKMMIDVPMPMSYATMKLAEQIEALEPYGKGNEKPLFAEKDLEILGARIMGVNRNVIRIKLRNSRGFVSEVIYFRPDEFEMNINRWFESEDCDKILKGIPTGCKLDVAYEVGINDFNGVVSLQFVLKAYDKA